MKINIQYIYANQLFSKLTLYKPVKKWVSHQNFVYDYTRL